MEKYYRISEASLLLGVCSKTIRRWESAGTIACKRTIGGHRRISIYEIERIGTKQNSLQSHRSKGAIAIYCRVSSHEQKAKGDLDRQLDAAKDYCSQEHLEPAFIFSDISSGLNTHRVGLKKLCALIERNKVSKVILTYQDRLTRFGFEYLQDYFKSFGTEIQVINHKPNCSMEEELVQDLIAIITSFSGRVHGLRSHKNGIKK